MASSTPAGSDNVDSVAKELVTTYLLSRNARHLLTVILHIVNQERGGPRAIQTIFSFATDVVVRSAIEDYLDSRSGGRPVDGARLLHLLVDKPFLAPLIRAFAERNSLRGADLAVFDTFIERDW